MQTALEGTQPADRLDGRRIPGFPISRKQSAGASSAALDCGRNYIYHNGNYGFQPTDPAIAAPPGDPKAGQLEDPWVYYFATLAELTLTNSVKADNPIGIHFSGQA